MRFFTSLLALSAALGSGCRLVDSLRAPRFIGRPDLPGYTIEEQERIGRSVYGIPDDDFRVGPRTGISRPDPIGVGY
jgi:hypothetical protein